MAPECWFRLECAREPRGAPKRRVGDPGADFEPVQGLERLGPGTPRKHDRLLYLFCLC